MKNCLTISILLFFQVFSTAQPPPNFPGKLYRITNIELISEDGFPLRGTMYSSSIQSPGILLLHMMGQGQRFEYENLATQLAMQGFHVFTVDLRGHGESQSQENFSFTNQTLAGDINTALRFLMEQPKLQSGKLGVLGSSGTVAEAIALASRHAEVKAVVGLSGHADEKDLQFISEANHLAIFGVGAQSDSIMTKVEGAWKLQSTAETMQAIIDRSTNTQSKLVIYEEAPHATLMLDEKVELIPKINIWFIDVLGIGKLNN